MDPSTFDRLSRALATSSTRRSTVAALTGALTARVTRLAPASDAAAQPTVCRPLNKRCFPSREIECCRGATCQEGICRCPKRTRRCGSRCLPRSKCCRNRDCPGTGRCVKGRCRRGSCRGDQCPCAAGQKRCQGRCIAQRACCACTPDQNCVNGACVAKQRCGAGAPCRVFVTASPHSGNLAGVAGADATCQALADASALTRGGTYRAWLAASTDASAPFHRFTNLANTGPYELVDGTLVANDWDDLTTSKAGNYLRAPINLTELGETPGDTEVWTNVRPDDGLPINDTPTAVCDNWTSTGGEDPFYGSFGLSRTSDERWSRDGSVDCSNSLRLYCFEQG